MDSGLTYRRLTPFGVEIDFDLTRGMTAGQAADYRSLYDEHHLLVFRGQRLTDSPDWPETHWDAIGYLGPTDGRVREAQGPRYLSTDPKQGVNGLIGLGFHSDYAFNPEPDFGVSLYAVDVVEDASSTTFASGAGAYAALPAALRERIGELQALMIWPLDQGGRNHVADLEATDPRHVHPIVWEHPRTGVPFIYLPETMTDSIVGVSEVDSDELVAELFGYLYAPDNIYEHKWRKGDMLVWDNRVLAHGRPPLETVGVRTLHHACLGHRTTVHPTITTDGRDKDVFVDPRWGRIPQSVPVQHLR